MDIFIKTKRVVVVMDLTKEINALKKTDIRDTIEKRLSEFDAFAGKGNDQWFSELCFCLLTANSKAQTALQIQSELGAKGFLCKSEEEISTCIKRNKHRFHNNKARFICEARGFKKIKSIIQKEEDPRGWLVKNIKGLGFKESSHFLRNVGYKDYAIVDRHILNLLVDNGYLEEKPTMNKSNYLKIENILEKICKKNKMSQAELDLYLWFIKTGKVLK